MLQPTQSHSLESPVNQFPAWLEQVFPYETNLEKYHLVFYVTKETEKTPSFKEAEVERQPVLVEQAKGKFQKQAEGQKEKEVCPNKTKKVERGKELLYREIERIRNRLLNVLKPEKKVSTWETKKKLFKILGFPPFLEMTPEEISQDYELLFHTISGQRMIKVLTRGSLDSKSAQIKKYGYAERKTPSDSVSKDLSISFCRGGTYWGEGPEGRNVAFALWAKEVFPYILFNETDYDVGEIRIFNPEFDPKNPETSEGATVDLAEKNFVILVGGKGREWFLEEIRRNWESLAMKERYKDVDEFITRHIVELPSLYEGKIKDWLRTNREQILNTFEGVQEGIEEGWWDSFETWCSMREEDKFEIHGSETIFGSEIIWSSRNREDPRGAIWNASERLLSLRLLEQAFNERFPKTKKPPLVKIEQTEKKFGFPFETPLRRAVLVTESALPKRDFANEN